MKKLFLSLAACIILFSCGQSKKESTGSEKQTVEESEIEEEVTTSEEEFQLALGGFDAVSYFSEGPVKGKTEFSTTYEGKIYYFASPENLDVFQENPTKFAPQYGGWCAYGMANGGRFPADPETYKIVDGKLLVFYNDGEKNTKNDWENGDETELIEAANSNWRGELE